MNLVLRGLSLNDNALSQPLAGRFDERGGSIGRSDNATMTLPDPERMISRVQANVSFGAGTYFLEDVGSANPVVHNGVPLGPGVKVPLRPNDDLRIGGYRLTVEYEQTDSAATIVRGRVQTAPAAPAGRAVAAAPEDNPFADLLGQGAAPFGASRGGQAGSDPFADLLNPSDAAPPPPPPSLPSAGRAGGARPVRPEAAAPARLPDDFDPFAEFAPQAPPPLPPEPLAPADPLAIVRPAQGAPSLDDMFGLATPGESDPMADFLAGGKSTPEKAGKQASLDPMAMFDAPKAPAVPVVPAASNHVPELAAAYQPPAVAAPPKAKAGPKKTSASNAAAPRRSAPAVAPPAEPGAKSSYTADEVWSGFLNGAGVDIPLPRGVTPELMQTVGLMLRASVEGMLQLIAVRAAAKNELRAGVTVIQVRENNPLKFSPDVTVALMQLLQPPGRGFLPGAEAIRDAMIDLQSHQIGTMAGMRAALAGVLDRFGPQLLEGRLTGQSMLDALLPMNRKAKLWELFLQHYRSIRDEAEEDFHQLFGKAFVEAYTEQVERLSASLEDPPAAR